ncbi:MAG: hypothetical protein IT385_09120 [Deltaproteobacteria bacterium]|nr:hypothetical protein [Deltaproteobacteria bacterium]
MLDAPFASIGPRCGLALALACGGLGCEDAHGVRATRDDVDLGAEVAPVDALVPGVDAPTSEVVARTCPADLLDGAGLALGRSDPEGCFERLVDGDALTIVHGIQGGIHVEIRIAAQGIEVGEGRIGFEVDLVADGSSLARFASEVGELRALVDAEAYATPAFPLIFPSPDASLYHGREAELRAAVTLRGARQTLPTVSVVLEDPLLALP